MIEPILGWQWELREAGVFLIPPAGERAGSIRYVERVRPLRRLVDLVAAFPVPAAYQAGESLPPEPFITAEGEHGALMVVRGTIDGAPIERTVAAVFVDDFYSLIGGVAWRPDLAPLIGEKVRALALSDRHHFGIRRRRFVYAPPPGWQGVLLPPYHACWLARDQRKHGGMLTVYPALPEQADVVAVRLLLDAGVPVDYDLRSGVPVNAAAGLSGVLHETETLDQVIRLAVLHDDRYAYPLLLTTTPSRQEEHGAMLLALIRSIEPIPRAGQNLGAASALAMWDE